jgi:hypothetical protein
MTKICSCRSRIRSRYSDLRLRGARADRNSISSSLREGPRTKLQRKLPAFLGASTQLFLDPDLFSESGSTQNPDLRHRYRVLIHSVSQFTFAYSTNTILLIRDIPNSCLFMSLKAL